MIEKTILHDVEGLQPYYKHVPLRTPCMFKCFKHKLWVVGMFKIKVVKDGLIVMRAGNLSIDGNKQN